MQKSNPPENMKMKLSPPNVPLSACLSSSVLLLVSMLRAAAGEPPPLPSQPPGETAEIVHGRKLFKDETFAGNGRTCLSCHSLTTGTVSPAEVQARYAQALLSRGGLQSDPLFRSLDSDDGVGEQYDRLLTNATIRAQVDLADNVSLASDPSARSVIVNRGIPSVINSGLMHPLMQDGRVTELEIQALAAILGHAQATQAPSAKQLHEIAEFERSLYSRPELDNYYRNGVAPELPPGNTPEEIRGRRHFEPAGLCGVCHSGPLLNQTSAFHPAGPGQRFENIFVSERNLLGNPKLSLLISNSDGTVKHVNSPDPGLALTSSEAPKGLFGEQGPVNFFRIPTLWNIKNTAPYFHDNSARTLEDVLQHYQLYIPAISNQDAQDIIAYLKLL